MRKRLTLPTTRLRGFIAALMVVVLGVVTFSSVFARAAQALPVAGTDAPAFTALSGQKTTRAKICHRMALPGSVNTCPLSTFSFGAVFGAVERSLFPPAFVIAGWRLNDASLPPQGSGPGFYRPPRARA